MEAQNLAHHLPTPSVGGRREYSGYILIVAGAEARGQGSPLRKWRSPLARHAHATGSGIN